MSNECTLVLKRSEPIDFIVANNTGIEKGAICMLSGPRTAAANSGTGDVHAGIARREKIASDGRTRLSLFTGPGDVFEMTAAAGPAIAAGSIVTNSGPNLIRLATTAEQILGKSFGKALQDFAEGSGSTTGEVMLI